MSIYIPWCKNRSCLCLVITARILLNTCLKNKAHYLLYCVCFVFHVSDFHILECHDNSWIWSSMHFTPIMECYRREKSWTLCIVYFNFTLFFNTDQVISQRSFNLPVLGTGTFHVNLFVNLSIHCAGIIY